MVSIALSVDAVESWVRIKIDDGRPAAAPPEEWWTDFFWHRAMFRQSYNRWSPEDVYNLLLQSTRGQLEFATVKDMQLLLQIQWDAARYEELYRRVMVGELYTIHRYFLKDPDRAMIYSAMGFERWEPSFLLRPTTGTPLDPRSLPDTRAALREWPSQNPISRLWEFRQVQLMVVAVLDQLMDVQMDLAQELAPRIGWDIIRSITKTVCPATLASHREERGEPGDPRRHPKQTFAPLPREPRPGEGPQPLTPAMRTRLRNNFWE